LKHSKYVVLLCSVLIFCQANNEQHDGDQAYQDLLIQTGKRCYDRGLFWGTGGDISVRVPDTDRFIIKGSMTCVGDLDYNKLSTVNLDGKHLKGPAPSHETPIHAEIYKLRKNVGAILHMHAPFSSAWATAGLKIPAITQQSVTLLKSSGIVPYYPVGSRELVEAIMDCYENPETKIVLMENHGVFVVGKDLSDLLHNAETLENTARIAYYCKALGTPEPFSAKIPD
jgi:L-ribulose-5-phosphate 4-epimerase